MPRGERALLSFLSLGVGWAVGFAYFVIYTRYTSGQVNHAFVVLFFTGLFTMVGGVVFVLPIVLFLPPRSRLFSPALCSVAGGVGAVGVCILLVAWPFSFPLWSDWVFLPSAFIIGFVGALTYALGLLGLRARS